MPAHRSEKKSSTLRKPREAKKAMTEEEKEDADLEKLGRKLARESKKEWEATLVPWTENPDFRFPIGTMAMYKSDAKSAYYVTEKEILTLSHEAIPCSAKTFYSQEDVKSLARRKFEAGAGKNGVLYDQVNVPFGGQLRLFKKTDNNNRSRRTNFTAQFFGYDDPSVYRRRRY